MRSGLLALAVILLSQSPCLSAEINDAARRGDIQTVSKLLDQGVAADAKDETSETPLLSASSRSPCASPSLRWCGGNTTISSADMDWTMA